MPKIKNYITQDDGTTTVVIEGVELDNKTSLLLDNGFDVEVNVIPVDPFRITNKQRKKIFALVKDIEIHTGMPMDYMRHMFIEYVRTYYGYDERISLSNCTRTQASQIIEVTIDWVFANGIILAYKTSNLLKGDKSLLYWATVNRNCVICGTPRAELAHYHAVGRGRNRRKIDHTDNKVLALCSKHHKEQHQIGMDSFNEKYKLHDSWVSVDERLNRILKGGGKYEKT